MDRCLSIILFATVLPVSLLASSDNPKGEAAPSKRVVPDYGKLPLSFEENRGQTDRAVDFVARGPGYVLFLTPQEAVFSLENDVAEKAGATVLRMKLLGARDGVTRAEGVGAAEGKANYFIGKDPKKWLTNVPTYHKARYRGVYPGIDLVYYGNQTQLEYDFVVEPGADPNVIRLQFAGAENVEINSAGDLLLCVPGATLLQPRPAIYQEIDGTRRPIEGGYVVSVDGEVSFALGQYDRTRPLVIDPVVTYASYLGGSGNDEGRDVAVDSAGNLYVCGDTTSTNFPTANPIQASFGGGTAGARDGFVTKINSTGTAIVYSTYLGGNANGAANGDDRCFGIAVDASGNAYVSGETHSQNFPTANAFQSNYGGGLSDAFVTKLNPAGSALIFSTYLGGDVFDAAAAVALDSARNVYVTGRTTSGNYPTVNPIQASYSGGAGADVFVTKINAAGTALVYSTYLGGNGGGGFETAFSIAIDSAGNACLTGQTSSTNFPTANAIQAIFGGGTPDGDAFATKINAAGSALVYSTYLGGTGNDIGGDIALDSSGNAYIGGSTFSANFPTANALRATISGPSDGFVTKLNANGTALVYSTYIGGSAGDSVNELAVDSAGNVVIAGGTDSTDFPMVDPIQNMFSGGGVDIFISKLNSAGSAFIYSTYFGGSGADRANTLALDSAGNVYLSGLTTSTSPLTGFQGSPGGGNDAFALKIAHPTVSLLLNIATRLQVQTGDNALIGGFIITGSDPKKVVIRGIGPSLAQLFNGTLPDPTIELFHGSTPLESNNNWQDTNAAAIQATGLAPSNDLESAIVRTLAPGSYTAILRGQGDATGIGVIEVYNLGQGDNSKLANIASRGFVETGDNVMIGGLIVGPAGSGSTRVVVRATGPSLAGFGINNAMQDPTLELVNSSGTVIRSNNNWRESQQTAIAVTGLQPSDDRESALVEMLAPGSYTAIVRGFGNTTGVATVEVYNVQ
jgi:hypothetical protein